MKRDKSQQAYDRAVKTLAGGIGSSAREWDIPFYVTHGEGSKIYDLDGNAYIDYVNAYGPLILGHNPPAQVAAIQEQSTKGIIFGACCELEFQVAEEIVKLSPCADRVRFTCSGSETIANVLRLARAYTGREKVVKFEGHFHGTTDDIYVSVAPSAPCGPDHAPWPMRQVSGQAAKSTRDVIVLPWNDIDAVERTLKIRAGEIAAVICEPVACYNVVTLPQPGQLEGLRELTKAYGVLLIFDEVVTGFRMALGGAQEYYGVVPDLVVYAKGVGGGVPLAAFGGRGEIMDVIASGKMPQYGTYNANPLCLAGALANLQDLAREDGKAIKHLNAMGARLKEGLNQAFQAHGSGLRAHGMHSVFSVIQSEDPPLNYRDFQALDMQPAKDFREAMFAWGIWSLGRGSWVMSAAHTMEDVDHTVALANEVLQNV